MLSIIATQPYVWGTQQEPPGSATWMLVMFVVLFVGLSGYLLFLGYSCVVEARSYLTSAHAWLLQVRVRRDLARHGLSNEQVIDALMGMDQFAFYMGNQLCVCVKGPDGMHQFKNLPANGGEPPGSTDRPPA